MLIEGSAANHMTLLSLGQIGWCSLCDLAVCAVTNIQLDRWTSAFGRPIW